MSATIFLAILAYSSLLPLSSSYYGNPFYTFAQTTRSTDLSLSNLIKQNAPYQRRISSAAVPIIDFSDLQCHLCNRFVKATEPQINSTYVQTGKIALVFEHLPNR
ncbi:MAG: thioredoxin domain-containing protein [Nitrososphaeraceae archaeon]